MWFCMASGTLLAACPTQAACSCWQPIAPGGAPINPVVLLALLSNLNFVWSLLRSWLWKKDYLWMCNFWKNWI